MHFQTTETPNGQDHSTPHPRLAWDFSSYPIQYLDLAVFANPCRPLSIYFELIVYDTQVAHCPHCYVCTSCASDFHLASRYMTRSETSPSAASAEELPILSKWRAYSSGLRSDFFDHLSQRSQRLTISPHPVSYTHLTLPTNREV